ncbi:hypothetical protein M9Y10_041313 [Tritrichomonas musculus]|uniref:Uncharacterized protein n=1 Tax=Tritrichomonas musculus TaxID=1915356 RepID=A0ABR2K4K9_9EUKA
MASPSPNKFNIPQSAFQIARPLDSPSLKGSRNSTPRKSKQSFTPRKQATPSRSKPGTLTLTPNMVILSCNSLIDFRDKYMKVSDETQTEPVEIATSPMKAKK